MKKLSCKCKRCGGNQNFNGFTNLCSKCQLSDLKFGRGKVKVKGNKKLVSTSTASGFKGKMVKRRRL